MFRTGQSSTDFSWQRKKLARIQIRMDFSVFILQKILVKYHVSTELQPPKYPEYRILALIV